MFEAVRRMAGRVFGRQRTEERRDPAFVDSALAIGEPRPGANSRSSRRAALQPLPASPVQSGGGPELESLQQKIASLKQSLQRERDFSRQTGEQANARLVEAMTRRLAILEARAKRLCAPPRIREGEALLVTKARICAARPACPAAEATGSDRSLVQAAQSASRRGKFAGASERAIFEKTVSDLTEGRADLRLHVLERLGALRCLAALPVFRAAALHASEEVRVVALRGVLAMGQPATRDLLIAALRDPSHRVRVQAVRGLYGLDDPALAEILCRQLRDPHPQVRRAAAVYLGWKRSASGERILCASLRDQSADVRAAVAAALGRCGSEASVFRLMVALGDPKPEVREAAAGALQRIVGDLPAPDVAAPVEQRAESVVGLKQWWKSERVRRRVGDAAVGPTQAPEPLPADGAVSSSTAAVDELQTPDASEPAAEARPAAVGPDNERPGLDDASPDLGSEKPDAEGAGLDLDAAESELGAADGEFVVGKESGA